MIESGTGWKGHVACMTDDRKTECWWRNLRETDHLEDTGVVGTEVLKDIL